MHRAKLLIRLLSTLIRGYVYEYHPVYSNSLGVWYKHWEPFQNYRNPPQVITWTVTDNAGPPRLTVLSYNCCAELSTRHATKNWLDRQYEPIFDHCSAAQSHTAASFGFFVAYQVCVIMYFASVSWVYRPWASRKHTPFPKSREGFFWHAIDGDVWCVIPDK